MMMDWHLTTLCYANLMVEHKLLGDAAFDQRYPIYFYKPEQFAKEVHKSLKMLNKDLYEKHLWGNIENLTLADILIFNELLSLNLVGHDISKYPELGAFLTKLYEAKPQAQEAAKPVLSVVSSKGLKPYVQSQKL